MSDETGREQPVGEASRAAGGGTAAGGPVQPERAAASASEEKAGNAATEPTGTSSKRGKEKPPKPSKEERARANEAYRIAKAQLKDARKRAGKSNAPKAIAGLVVALVLVAGGAAAGWFFTNERGTQQVDALQTQLSSTRQQLDAANEQVEQSSSILDRGSRAYNGTWTGDLVSTLGAATKRCYGASGKSMKLDIESISATGQMELGVSTLYHGHETATLANDVTRHDGDATLSADGITSTFSSKSFSFRVEGDRDGDYAVVTVSPTTSADAHIQLGVVVESYWRDGLVETDQYLLKKRGDESSASESAGGTDDATASAAGSTVQSSPDSSAASAAEESAGSADATAPSDESRAK